MLTQEFQFCITIYDPCMHVPWHKGQRTSPAYDLRRQKLYFGLFLLFFRDLDNTTTLVTSCTSYTETAPWCSLSTRQYLFTKSFLFQQSPVFPPKDVGSVLTSLQSMFTRSQGSDTVAVGWRAAAGCNGCSTISLLLSRPEGYSSTIYLIGYLNHYCSIPNVNQHCVTFQHTQFNIISIIMSGCLTYFCQCVCYILPEFNWQLSQKAEAICGKKDNFSSNNAVIFFCAFQSLSNMCARN